MNSVSMPRRPVARARSARSVTVVSTVDIGWGEGYGRRGRRRAGPDGWRGGGPARGGGGGAAGRGAGRVGPGPGRRRRRLLVGPVAVAVEEVARRVLGVALAVAQHSDAGEQAEQAHRH